MACSVVRTSNFHVIVGRLATSKNCTKMAYCTSFRILYPHSTNHIKFLPSPLKSKLWSLFLSRLSSALGGSTVLDIPLFYSSSLFSIIQPQPLLRLLIHIYMYMYTCSFIVHILLPFIDLYFIHYVFIVYSTLNIVSLCI